MEYKKIITIDSLFRENSDTTTSSDFRVHLRDNVINVVSMKLHDIILPHSWYRFSKEQNNTSLIIKGSGADILFTLPDGNYQTLADIQIALTPSSGITLSQNPNTKKITVTTTLTDFSIKLSNYGCDDTRGLAWLLGFRKDTGPGSGHEAEGLLLIDECIRYRYFYLIVDDNKSIDNFNAEPMLRKKFINGFILARLIIQIQEEILTNVSYDKYTRIYDGPCDINKLDIKLVDEWGYIVNLNEMDLSLSLELTVKL